MTNLSWPWHKQQSGRESAMRDSGFFTDLIAHHNHTAWDGRATTGHSRVYIPACHASREHAGICTLCKARMRVKRFSRQSTELSFDPVLTADPGNPHLAFANPVYRLGHPVVP